MAARPDSERLVFLHGFTQTHHHWHRVAELIRRRHGPSTTAYVDLPGHGLSATDRTAIDQAGRALTALAGTGTYIGYSMGGRFALGAALGDERAIIERLVLIGATPGIDDPGERAARVEADEQRARQVERIGVDRFIDEWLALPMFARLPDDPRGLARRRRNTAAGLASSLRLAGTGRQGSWWPRLGAIRIPTLVLAGEDDVKFTEIGRRTAEQIPDATFVAVPAAGHAAHTEQPFVTAALIADWLTSNPA